MKDVPKWELRGGTTQGLEETGGSHKTVRVTFGGLGTIQTQEVVYFPSDCFVVPWETT